MPIWVKFGSGKKHDSGEEKERTQKKKTTFENDNDGAIPESVSKLNIIISYDDANNAS